MQSWNYNQQNIFNQRSQIQIAINQKSIHKNVNNLLAEFYSTQKNGLLRERKGICNYWPKLTAEMRLLIGWILLLLYKILIN